jgi:hypothetical protein
MFRSFLKDRSGSTVIVSAAAMPVMLLAVAVAIDVGSAIDQRQRLLSAAELACHQSSLFLSQQQSKVSRNPSSERSQITMMVDDYLRMQGVEVMPWNVSVEVQPRHAKIAIQGEPKAFLAEVVYLEPLIPKVVLDCSAKGSWNHPALGWLGPSPGELVRESFAEPASQTMGRTLYNGWTATGGYSVASTPISDGELAAHLSGESRNGRLAKRVRLDEGQYELVYSFLTPGLSTYRRDPLCGTPEEIAQGLSDPAFETRRVDAILIKDREKPVILDTCLFARYWTERRITFATTGGDYTLAFAGSGRADGISGWVDDIRLCRVRCE